MSYFVYKLTAPNGHGYIGITGKSVMSRWNWHIRDAKGGAKFALHCAMRKYGHETFSVETLCECVDAREAKVCERALIAAHGTFHLSGRDYNLTIGGDGNHGWKMSDETKKKIGEKSKGRIPSAESRAKMSAAGKGRKIVRTPEHAAKIGAKLKGRVMSAEWRAKIGAAGVGRKMSEETKQKLREARKNYKASPESIAKMRATKTGVKLSDDRKEKIRQALLNRAPLTDAQKDARKKRFQLLFADPEYRERHRQRLIARNKAKIWDDSARAQAAESSKKVADKLPRNADGTFGKMQKVA